MAKDRRRRALPGYHPPLGRTAFAWEAYVWSELPKGRTTTAREVSLDNLERMWLSHELNNFVVTMPAYQASLLGRVLVSPQTSAHKASTSSLFQSPLCSPSLASCFLARDVPVYLV